jgi:hypothetical protein
MAGAQCLGDFDGNGMVAINEIITSVNNALNGCQGTGATPTPTPMGGSCPIDFSDDNTAAGTPDCFYTGRWNQSCGDDTLEARWISNGQFVVVGFLGFPGDGLFYGAQVTSATAADLVGWFTKADASDLQASLGSLTLGSSGDTLVVAPNDVPFQVDGCDFARYDGVLTDVVQPSAAPPAVRLPADSAALQRLRDAAAARSAKPDFRRR